MPFVLEIPWKTQLSGLVLVARNSELRGMLINQKGMDSKPKKRTSGWGAPYFQVTNPEFSGHFP